MQRLATLAVLAALISPTLASGQDYTFGDWARDHGYSPGDVMPNGVWAERFGFVGIDSLNGIGEFDWATTPTTMLDLDNNRLSSIASGDFNGLTSLEHLSLVNNQLSRLEAGAFGGLTSLNGLELQFNQISSIESGGFSGLTNLTKLWLGGNTALKDLDLSEADFSSLIDFDVRNDASISSVSLRHTVVNQTSFTSLLGGGDDDSYIGIGELDGITEMDLSGIDFDAFDTAGGGLLAAWDAEPGHHIEFLHIGDVNHDTEVNGLDVDPFVDVLLASRFDVAADMNGDGLVNGLDVEPFVEVVVSVQSVPEPSTLLLCIALGVVGAWRKWGV